MSNAIGWDSTIDKPQEGSDFVLLPEGVYPYRVVAPVKRSVKEKSSPVIPAGTPTAEVKLLVNGETNIERNFYLHEQTIGFIASFFTSAGFRQHGQPLEMKWFDQIMGKQGYCRVSLREYTGRDGDKRLANEIKAFLDPEDGAAKFEAQKLNPPAPVVMPSPQPAAAGVGANGPATSPNEEFDWDAGPTKGF